MGQPPHSRMPHTGGPSPIRVTTFLASMMATIKRAQIGSICLVLKPLFYGLHLVRGEGRKQVLNRDIRR
jgi:hypothetical protein